MDRRARRRAGALLGVIGTALIAAVACSTTTLQGTLSIITGPDNGFTVSPQPNLLVVDFVNAANGVSTFAAQTRLPSDGGLTLPSQPGANVDSIAVIGYDDAGDAVVSGTTIPFALDQVSGITINVFVQRNGQFSRLPSAEGGSAAVVNLPSPTPLMTNLYSRYLLIADGTGKSTATQLYDTLFWQTEPDPPCLAIPSLSLAAVNTYTGTDAAPEASAPVAALLEIGPNGTATWLDITDSTGCGPDAEVAQDASAPEGGSFAQVAGGQTIVGPVTPLGNTYIVGGTRPTSMDAATGGVLRVSSTGVMSWVNLQAPRLGAAAAYSTNGTNPGVYVFGGQAAVDGGVDATTGVEFVSEMATIPTATFPALGLPRDTVTGAGAVALDSNTILLAGGVMPDGKPAPVRVYSMGGEDASTAMCGATANGGADAAGAPDAGVDAGHDAGTDAAHDASRDATLRADAGGGQDAGGDAVVVADTGVDAGHASSGWPKLPVTFVTTQVYALTAPTSPQGPSVMVVGTEKSGVSSAYIVSCSTVTRVPFKEARSHAGSILLANGALAVVGGDSGTMESFIP